MDDAIQPPADTVRHDADDAYLVVAADKGTATFSDIANGLSIERGHWLGDAFASGGSQGYDHKGMGITARGAWEAVKRHFQEIDIDTQSDPITVVGVGDMSGDVFGNGMLLSRSLRLVAAFDHRDIFLDPDPDGRRELRRTPAPVRPRPLVLARLRSGLDLGGRRRLFPQPEDDPALAPRPGRARNRRRRGDPGGPHAGHPQGSGGSPLVRRHRHLHPRHHRERRGGRRPRQRRRAHHRRGAPRQGRREGANLGATQRGRIEAARAGVRLNTDAIDNSAGVNTSDVEVNIKIALMGPERDGRLDAEARNALLVAMTDEVAALVLRNNQLQTLALSLAQHRGLAETGFAQRTMQALEAEGRLDRPVELLPDDATLAERMRKGEGLTRPEYAVILAYAKLAFYDALLASTVPNDPYFDRELQRYFPAALRQQFPDAVKGHRLRREIISTALSNIIVNRGGPSLVTRLTDETGADAAAIAKAYAITRDAYGLMELNLAIDGLAGAIGGQAQIALYAEVQDLLIGRIVWFIRNLDLSGPIAPVVARYREGIAALQAVLPEVMGGAVSAALDRRTADLVAQGMGEAPARRLASLAALTSALDIVRVAETGGAAIPDIAATHFALDRAFHLSDLAAAARGVATGDTFDRIALERAVSNIATAHRQLTAEIIDTVGAGLEAVTAWSRSRGATLDHARATLEVVTASGLTVSKATVAASLLADLARPR